MKTQRYLIKDFESYFKRHKIATLDQLQRSLRNPKERTVFRKLKFLDYLSSYSHRGKYYTLQSIAEFNVDGLWCHRTVWFSRFGSLIDTARAFVEHSEAGYTAAELQEALHVQTKHCLLKLIRAGYILREKLRGCYVYFCSEPNKYRLQVNARKHEALAAKFVANSDLAEQEARAIVLLFLSALDERQRRLFAGLESLKLGYGGDIYIANLFGLDPHTVARGRRELEKGDWDTNRLRGKDGGRKRVEKKHLKS